ncbi:MAG: DNA repair protein RecN [Candidatus Eremiobacteraeota bacterium]|nr:DNA repair protein RecN [Candidatus Eremiobacteraeota bacterium]
MLRRLQIENYGLIARADVEFADGATIFTGETGSGKTMLLGALDFALGARAGADAVRRGERRAIVTLAFDADESLRARLEADGFELDSGEEGSITREMAESGRSSVRVNGRPATAAYVREIGEAVAEIVGQHEAQRLLSPAYHLEMLDRFGGAAAMRAREAVASAHAESAAARAALAALVQDEHRARERYDDACFTVREIEDARLQPGEEDRLDGRRRYLDNVERIATALEAARNALVREEGGALEALGAAAVALGGVERYAPQLHDMAQRGAALQADAGELAVELARALDGTEFDPAELEAINARLALLDRLKRKHGCSLDELVELAIRQRRAIEDYENRDRSISELRAQTDVAQCELERAAASLSTLRKKVAADLRKRVLGEFADIALASGSFDVAFEPLERIGEQGAERVEFLFAANAGEPARPLARVASGGELSRVLLALVVVLSRARDARGALIFDEIDTAIGGATATAVGSRLGALARREQVVCVTHLAQLATWADRHYVLDKSERTGITTIGVRELDGAKEREAEIARMLSGETHDAALRHARALLQSPLREGARTSRRRPERP